MAKMYDMDHAKRGIALVINIKTYEPNPFKLKERVWSVEDVKNLKTTLDYLEFDLRFYENLTANKIREKIQKIAGEDHTNSDCFLCVVMSHGNKDKIVASDSEEISFKEIMQPIKESCKSLEKKPKLFFFQACRGDKDMETKNQRPDSGVSTKSGNSTTDHKDDKTSKNNNNTMHAPKQNTHMESESDLLVYNSTLPDHYAYGSVAEGTLFIKNVCKELNQAYKNLPNNIKLSDMLMNINNNVSESGKQLALPELGLLKDVNFTPKKVSEKI
jgi:hypothetical protein